jgi:polar amino acid transport system substrate-binding protein
MKHFLYAFLLLVSFSAQALADSPVFDRVTKSGTVRCGYALWTPVLYKEANTGEIKGIVHDLMEEAGKRLDLKIEWAEETGWGTMVEGLMAGRYDIICTGVYHTSARAKFIDVGTPIFYSPLYVVVRKDDTRFDKDLGVLNDAAYKIAVLEGEVSSIAARQVFPKAAAPALPQMQDYSMLLKEVETGKADATLIEASTYKAYEAKNPGILKALEETPVTVSPTGIGLPRQDPVFSSMMNVAFVELLNDGTVDRILKKYEEHPGAFLRVAKPYQAVQ